jgi:hypothetical protein
MVVGSFRDNLVKPTGFAWLDERNDYSGIWNPLRFLMVVGSFRDNLVEPTGFAWLDERNDHSGIWKPLRFTEWLLGRANCLFRDNLIAEPAGFAWLGYNQRYIMIDSKLYHILGSLHGKCKEHTQYF